MLASVLTTWLVTSLSLFILSRLSLGTEVEDFYTALWSAAVLGAVNAILGPIFRFFSFPITFLTFGLFAVVINAILFGITAYLVKGFRLQWGFLSALVGAVVLSLLNSLIFNVLPSAIA
ncbi:phage holin family protein [Lyngbya confervoides]|uniref:Phage holin family protein n=1 Tax=Lyngbya confervoides BDU141951 TaxID=1574623 RepID=A0ABD4T7Y6_9CYAN|nr:phage holin family protein [Lyngbya confervoides]MCM1984629.1 phage holin family protein [Lyngbya confervoides BDU141951]